MVLGGQASDRGVVTRTLPLLSAMVAFAFVSFSIAPARGQDVQAHVQSLASRPGADPTGATDSTAAFQAAANAGPYLAVGPGTYLINGTVALRQTGCHVSFAGQGSTTIKVGAPKGDAFLITGSHCTLDGGVSFVHPVARTAGADIHCSAAYCHVGPIYDDGAYWAVEIDGNAVLAYVDRPSCRNIVPDAFKYGGACVRVGVTGSNESSIINSPFADVDGTASASTVPTAGILDDFSDALQILNPNIIHGKYDILLAPGSGDSVLATQISAGGFLDAPLQYALALVTVGGGNIVHTAVTGVAMSDAAALSQSSAAGIRLSQSGTGTLEGFTCTGCDLFLDGPSGVSTSGYVEDVTFNGGCIAGVTDGLTTSGHMVSLSLEGGLRIGTCNGFSSVTNGVHLSGSNSSVDIAHVNFTGTTKPILGLGSLAGANNRIQDNPGYNPIGGAPLVVGSSPWTYQNGPTPATLYVSGGLVSAIYTGGIVAPYNSGGSAYSLGPNQTIQIVFSSPPTINQLTQ